MPTDDRFEKSLDLNKLPVQKQAATFFVGLEGDSIIAAGIFSNEILILDRSDESVT